MVFTVITSYNTHIGTVSDWFFGSFLIMFKATQQIRHHGMDDMWYSYGYNESKNWGKNYYITCKQFKKTSATIIRKSKSCVNYYNVNAAK